MAARIRPGREAGFTIVELVVVIAILGIMAAMAVMATPAALQGMRADSTMQQVIGALRGAKERAVSERRDFEVRFVGQSEIQVWRLGVPPPGGPAPAPTLVSSVIFENNVQFWLTPGLPDTPDAFGNAAAVDFGAANTFIFRAEGMFTDQNPNLDPINGTIFVANPREPLTARAVTVFGPTALISGFRWNGLQWVD